MLTAEIQGPGFGQDKPAEPTLPPPLPIDTPQAAVKLLLQFHADLTAHDLTIIKPDGTKIIPNTAVWPVLVAKPASAAMETSRTVGHALPGDDNIGYFYVSQDHYLALKTAAVYADGTFPVRIGVPAGVEFAERYEKSMGTAGELAEKAASYITKIKAVTALQTPPKKPGIPMWAWLAGGAVLLVGAGVATAVVVRGRETQTDGYGWGGRR